MGEVPGEAGGWGRAARQPLRPFGPLPMNGEELLRSADSPPGRAAAQNPDRRRLGLLAPAWQSLAAPLVLVQVSIGRLVDGLPILARGPCGDPDADLDVLRRAHPQSGVVDGGAEAGRHVAGAIDVRLRHGDRKLIAAYPRAQVGCTDHAQELLSHEPQRAVTRAVPEPIVDPLQVIEVDHHQGQPAIVSLSQRHLALHHPLELAPVGKARQVIRARLAGELSRAIDRNRGLVGNRGHEEKVGRAENAIAHRTHRHHADGPAAYAQLGPQRVPLLARDAIDLRLGTSERRRPGLDMRPGLSSEIVDLIWIEPTVCASLYAERSRNHIAPVLKRRAASASTSATSAVSSRSSERLIAETIAASPYISLSRARCSSPTWSR